MSLAQFLSTYLTMNFLIIIGFLGLGLLSFMAKKLKFSIGSGTELRLHYLVIMCIFTFTLIHPFLPKNKIFSPAAKVWSAQSIKSFGQDYATSDKAGYISLSTPMGNSVLKADRVVVIWAFLACLLMIFGGLFIARDLRMLLLMQKKSFLIRRLGRVRILISDVIEVPFSYWLPRQANIVIPLSLVSRPNEFKMATAHELQHHRHGDTRWVYVMWGLKLMCIINPAIHIWNRWISEIQEFACDETLVDRKKVESRAYARCLVEVAQSAIDQRYVPVCATGLTFLVERNLLKRRIEKMLSKPINKIRRSIIISVGAVIATIMCVTAFASKALVQDRRINLSQAQAMFVRAKSEGGFPVVVNDLVLKQLNRYIGTPEGREFMRKSLHRMEVYKPIIAESLKKYDVPLEIMAMPIIESGYQNLTEEESATPMKAAGLWQFIPSTARNFGLRVDAQKDERLNIVLNTDAAARLLQSDNLRFNDWALATMAYNMGEVAVQAGINATGSRDAWTLIRKGYEGDKDYLARLNAAILIMRNPESIE